MKNLLLLSTWLVANFLALIFCLGFLSNYSTRLAQASLTQADTIYQIPYQFYTSIPKVLGAKSIDEFHVKSQDIIPEIVYNYMKRYDSPMLETYQSFVDIARKYDIDPLFMLSIAQCESNLGKKMPYKEEDKLVCKNPFGWGIHQRGTLCFDSWEEGYEAVAKGLKEKYYDKGYETTEDIMAKYTPPALEKNGSWAKCVNHFLGQLQQAQASYQLNE
jgi:hypothetical protein